MEGIEDQDLGYQKLRELSPSKPALQLPKVYVKQA